jgi:antitoxin component YwqK of YwqJK toxin-antitoxin module
MQNLSCVILFLVLLLSGCGDNSSNENSEGTTWRGTEAEFEESFELKKDTDHSRVLINTETKKKFDGTIETNQSDAISLHKYKDGKLDGESVKKSPNGSQVKANFEEGKLHGEMILLDSKGQVRSIINYQNGTFIPPKKE